MSVPIGLDYRRGVPGDLRRNESVCKKGLHAEGAARQRRGSGLDPARQFRGPCTVQLDFLYAFDEVAKPLHHLSILLE